MENERLSRARAQAADSSGLPGPPGWARQAACAGKASPGHDPWHPPPEAPWRVRRALVAEAIAVCAVCPVQVQCGRYGLELLNSDGALAVYGGMTPADLRDMARRLGRSARLVARHGTRSRYVNARCRCAPCAGANRRYEHARRIAKRRQRRDCQARNTLGKLCGKPVRDGSIFCADDQLPHDA